MTQVQRLVIDAREVDSPATESGSGERNKTHLIPDARRRTVDHAILTRTRWQPQKSLPPPNSGQWLPRQEIGWTIRIERRPLQSVSQTGDDTMQIYGPSQIHGPQALGGPHSIRSPQRTAAPSTPAIGDQLDISESAQLLSQAHDVPDVREDLVARVRSQITGGTYETPERLDGAVDRLLDEIG
jgi:negative regulator of flagellin synthesis FlgM